MGTRIFALSCLRKDKQRDFEESRRLVLSPLPHYPSMPRYPESPLPADRDSMEVRKAMFKVTGMECSACAGSIEKAIKRLTGIQDATVDVLQNRAQAVYHPAFTNESANWKRQAG